MLCESGSQWRFSGCVEILSSAHAAGVDAPVYLKGMRGSLFIAILFVIAFQAAAQPLNTSCTSAIIACAGQTVTGTNTGSTASSLGVCPQMANTVWYSFMTNSQGGEVRLTITGIDCPDIEEFGDELVAVVLSAPNCNGPFSAVSDCVSNAGQLEVITDGLDPNTRYWIMIGGETGPVGVAECGFSFQVGGPGADVLGVDIIVSEDVTIGVGESTQLNVATPGVPGTGITYSWSPTTGLSNASISDPIASPASTTNYTVTINVGECTYTAQVIVEVIRRINPPNTFTPNADGRNDTWEIPGMYDYPGAEVQIFDRWGQRVYRSTGYREPWDGTFNGARLPDATYYYHIQLNQLEGQSPPYTGFISIIR
jgi:gliding motility-associated-like protein